MLTDIISFLETQRSKLIRKWLDSTNADSICRSSLSTHLVEAWIGEIYNYIFRYLEDPSFADELPAFFNLEGNQSPTIDLLIGLQNIVLLGKRILEKEYGQFVPAHEQRVDDYLLLDEAFTQFVLRINTAYTKASLLATPRVRLPGDDQNIVSKLNLFYNAFQYSTDGIVITNLDGNVVEANNAFLKVFGYTHEEVIGKSTNILRSSKTTDQLYQQMWESIITKGEWKGEIVNRCKSGEEIPIWLSITPVFERGQKVGYMAVEIDMRQQKKLEEKLLQSERLAIIGQMAAKVAHEIRNPLSSISLNAELLEDELRMVDGPVDEEAETLLHSIISEVDRVALLTEEYLQFSRLPGAEPELGDVVKLVADVVEFIEPQANSAGVQVVANFENDIPKLIFDPHQIRRVLLNLSRNAIEAMPKGGVLRFDIAQSNGCVDLEVSDTGEGVQQKNLERIFEPFFTTKDMGTGLGLAIVRQIVQEHGGVVRCESPEGMGARFHIKLPLSRNEKNLNTAKE